MESAELATSDSAASRLGGSSSAGLASIFARASVWNVAVWRTPKARLSSMPTRPDSPGTVILPEYEEKEAPVRAIVHKDGIYLINLVSPPMLAQHGFLAKVFTAAERHEIDVDLVATSEVSITMTTDRADNLTGFCEELSTLGDVSVEENHALLCVVG